MISPRSTPAHVARAEGDAELPPIDDPYARGPREPRKKPLSPLALTSIVAPFALGPLGSVAAIVFGWAARRELGAGASKGRGYVLGTLGMVLGVCMTVAWGATIAFGVWTMARRGDAPAFALARHASMSDEPAQAGETVETAEPAPDASSAPPIVFQKETTIRKEGRVTVVDVGASVSSLSRELAKQRADAASAGELLLVMTTRAGCAPCRRVADALGDPLMQTALAGVRLVRVDIDAFEDDLDGLRVPHDRSPGFSLLAPDLCPRDAIDGGEWDEDVAANIAPVLGAFVRGKYAARRQRFEPIPENGIRL